MSSLVHIINKNKQCYASVSKYNGNIRGEGEGERRSRRQGGRQRNKEERKEERKKGSGRKDQLLRYVQ